MDTKLIEQALHAAEQNMTDVTDLWRHGRTSDLVFWEAIQDMKRDGLRLVKQARAALAVPAAPAAAPDAGGAWCIMKSTRTCWPPRPYAGGTCQDVGIERGRIYRDHSEAVADATKLTRCNPAGFTVMIYSAPAAAPDAGGAWVAVGPATMPMEYEAVLVAVASQWGDFNVLKRTFLWSKQTGWVRNDSAQGKSEKEFTHWMSLPSPPPTRP